MKRIALLASIALLGATPAVGQITTYMPAEPTSLHIVQNEWSADCREKDAYLVSIIFQSTSDTPEMKRAAEQAARSYARPEFLMNLSNGDSMLRALEIEDTAGLLRFVSSLKDDPQLSSMIEAIPKSQRFSSIDDQEDAITQYYLDEVAETGGPTHCKGAGN